MDQDQTLPWNKLIRVHRFPEDCLPASIDSVYVNKSLFLFSVWYNVNPGFVGSVCRQCFSIYI